MLKFILPTLLMLSLPIWQPRKYIWRSRIIALFFLSCSSIILFNLYRFDIFTQFSFSFNLLSLTLITLSLWVTGLIYISRFKILINNNRTNKFHILVLGLCIILIVGFITSNLFLFYIIFEASLIPTLLLILGWGYQPERLQAGTYLIIYTVTASLPLLASILFLNHIYGHISLTFPLFTLTKFRMESNIWWLITIIAFLVKTPIYLTHLWLPKAHVEAPVAGSIVLAGILLKLGSYGLIRLSQSFLSLNLTIAPAISTVSLLGAILAGAICIRQTDIKSLIAYSSVRHIGLVTAGVLRGSIWGWYGSLAIIIAHGLCSSCIFSLANITYESTNSRSTYITKGILIIFPALSIWWFLLSACNMAAPPAINLIAEIILITRIIRTYNLNIILLAPIRFIAAAYRLILFTSTNHGPLLQFSNPLSLFINRNYTICLLHLIPIITLIARPNFITCFL